MLRFPASMTLYRRTEAFTVRIQSTVRSVQRAAMPRQHRLALFGDDMHADRIIDCDLSTSAQC